MTDDAVKDHLLCAFLDEELAQQDVDKLLDLLECEDTRARACRQAMTGPLLSRSQTPCVDISAAVRAAIAQEPPLQALSPAPDTRRRGLFARRRSASAAASQRPRRGWQVPASGVALAATVAMAALVIFKPAATDAPQANAQVAQADTPITAAQEAPAMASESSNQRVAQLNPSVRQPAATRSLRPGSAAPAQLVAAGNRPSAHAGGRELVIASPQQSRPVSAQWSLVAEHNAQAQNQALQQQRARQQLNTYLINHARQGGGSALPGALGYARVAARPAQRTGTE